MDAIKELPEVPMEMINSAWMMVMQYGLSVVYAIVVLIIGFWIAGMCERGMRRALTAAKKIDPMVVGFFGSLVRYFVLAVVLIAVLQLFGIQTTSLIAVLGAASLAVGLALQGTLSNLAAGVMLLVFRPFKVGQTIDVAGKSGVVKDLTLFLTEVQTADNLQVLIPNGQVWGAAIVNRSAYPSPNKAIELSVEIAPSRDVEGFIAAVRSALANDSRFLPGASVLISSITEEAIGITVSALAPAANADAAKADLFAAIRGQLARMAV
ncbi:mechanosensitive ion channel family protein [Segnochrobactraceae bacterium EtOH-i3]